MASKVCAGTFFSKGDANMVTHAPSVMAMVGKMPITVVQTIKIKIHFKTTQIISARTNIWLVIVIVIISILLNTQ